MFDICDVLLVFFHILIDSGIRKILNDVGLLFDICDVLLVFFHILIDSGLLGDKLNMLNSFSVNPPIKTVKCVNSYEVYT